MRIRQLYRWASARLWAFLPVAVIAVSGCATIESYQQAKVEYDRQTRQNKYLVRQYSEDIRKLNERQIDYNKTLADEARLEARLKKENTRLRQHIAKVESALNGQPATQQTPPDSAFKELGRNITAQTYELVLKELGDYSNLENLYNRQLKTLSSYQNGSPEYIREAEIIRAQALLDVISEAIVTVNIPREALRESTLADDPKFEQALITLANAQDQMLIALNDFKLQGQDQSNSNYSIAQSSCVNMLAALTDLIASQDSSPLAEDLIMRLKTMHTVTEVAKILLSTINALMNSSTPLEVRGGSDALPPIAQQLSYLIAMRANISAVEIGQPTNSAIRFLNRMEWIMTMSTYCQGDAFKPETYLQMRLGEIRPLKAAVLEVIESYKINKFKNLEVGASEMQTQPLQTQTWKQLADINSALIQAARVGDTAKVKQLLKQGADVNAKDKFDWTALLIAQAHGHTDTAKILIDADKDFYYQKGLLAVGFKKGVSQAIAEEILKSLNLKYKRTINLNMGKRFFYKTGEKFSVRVPDGEELMWLEKLNKIPEIEATGRRVDPRKALID